MLGNIHVWSFERKKNFVHFSLFHLTFTIKMNQK